MYDLKLPDVNIKHKGLFLPIRSAAVCMSSLIRNTSLIWIKASTWYGYVLMISCHQGIKYIQKYNKCILLKCNNLNSRQFEILAVLVKTTDNIFWQNICTKDLLMIYHILPLYFEGSEILQRHRIWIALAGTGDCVQI